MSCTVAQYMSLLVNKHKIRQVELFLIDFCLKVLSIKGFWGMIRSKLLLLILFNSNFKSLQFNPKNCMETCVRCRKKSSQKDKVSLKIKYAKKK